MSFRTLISVVVCTLVFPFSQSFAASVIEPQILALIASSGSKTLTCQGETCAVEFSAFCMEPGRPGPAHATPYVLTPGAQVTLQASDAAGRSWQVPISMARFTSQRGYAAVRISVPRAVLRKIGAVSLRAKVGKRVVLQPQQHPDYVRPHGSSELAAAMGANRIIGERLVDNGGKRADGARLLSYMINALPVTGKVSAQTRQNLWQVTQKAPSELQKRGRAVAEAVYNNCAQSNPLGQKSTLRECLQHGHDRNMWLLNQVYWQSVGPQS